MGKVAGKSVRTNERHSPDVSCAGIDALVDRRGRFNLGKVVGDNEENRGVYQPYGHAGSVGEVAVGLDGRIAPETHANH